MKLTDLQLEKYGIYEKASWQPPERGLCVVMGENESGKTTLLRFIRDMLFGYRRGKRQGRKGNLAFCRDNGRVYRIYRHEGKSTLLDDREEKVLGEPADLWWHGLDRKTYEQVFAVGLEDLQGAEILGKDEVRSRFLSIQGGESLADAQAKVEAEMEELLVASSQGKRRINNLLNRLQEAELAILSLADQETEFAQIRAEQKTISEQIAETEEAIRVLDVRDRTMDKQLGAWKHYEEGMETKRLLDLCKDIHHFPADGKERWNNLMGRMANLQEQRDVLAEKMAPLQARTEEEVVPWHSYRDEIAALYLEGSRWQEREQELAAKEQEILDWQEQQAELLATYPEWAQYTGTMGMPEWSEGKVLAAAVQARDNELHFHRHNEPTIDAVEEDEEILPRCTTEEEFELCERAGRELLTAARDKNMLLGEKERVLAEPRRRYSAFFWLGFLLLWGAVGALYSFYSGWIGKEGLYLAGAITFVALLCFYTNHHRSHRNEYRLLDLEKQIEQVENTLQEKDRILELGIPETEEEMAKVSEDLEEIRRDFYRYQARLQARSWHNETRRRQLEEHAIWEAQGEKLQQDQAQTLTAWQEWLAKNSLPDVSVDELTHIEEIWQMFFTAQGQGQVLRAQADKMRADIDTWRERTKKLAQSCGVDGEATPDLIVVLAEGLQEQLLEWQSAKEKNAHYHELAKEKAVLDERWQLCENEMQALFDLVDAKDATEFADKVIAYEQCDQLRQKYERIRQNLRLYAGNEAEFDRLWEQLETGEYKAWMERRAQYESSLLTHRTNLTKLRQREGALASELKRLTSDDSLAKALQNRSAIHAELEEETDRYLALVFTQYTMNAARQKYEAESQPDVVSRAGKYLQAMTSGRYTLSINAEGQVRTVDTAHEYKESELWSSGTGDQVYLALRLALALAFSERTEEMPIILDDIFVRFDEKRQKETLQFLSEFAVNKQVLIFTCHEQTLRLAKELNDQRIHFYRLQNGQIQHDQ